MARVLSAAGLHEIASFEGFSPTCYDDGGAPGVGNCTIGYGHLIHLGPTTESDRARWGTITVDAGLALLRSDTAYYSAAVAASIKVRLGIIPGRAQCRFDQLVSLCFNIGRGAFESSSLVAEINKRGAPRDWTTLGPLWLEWDHAGGAVVPGLLTRRRVEFQAFRSGKYPT